MRKILNLSTACQLVEEDLHFWLLTHFLPQGTLSIWGKMGNSNLNFQITTLVRMIDNDYIFLKVSNESRHVRLNI